MKKALLLVFLLALWATPVPAAEAPQEPPAEDVHDPNAGMSWLLDRAPEWLGETTFLLANWQWLGLLLLVVVGVVLDFVTALILRRIFRRLLRTRTEEESPESLWHRAERPFGKLVLGLFIFLALPLLNLEPSVRKALCLAATIVATCAGVWATYRLVDIASLYFLRRAQRTATRLDDMLIPLARRIVKIFVVAIGIVFVAQNLDIEVGSLLAGLGIGGLAFALAAKDTVANVFGSLTVLLDQPFQIGDWVVIDGVEGTVERVGFRSTRIRTFYNSLISLPNAKLISGVVDNFGARKYRRYKARFGLAYSTTPAKVEAFCEAVRELVRLHPYTRRDYFHVYLNDLGESALEVLVYIFHECPDWATELRERHRFLLDSLRAAERLGVEFAFPTRTIQVEGADVEVRHRPDAGTPEPGKPSAGSPATPEALEEGRSVAEEVVRRNLKEGEIPPAVSFE
jgi:MscS family membrane protein